MNSPTHRATNEMFFQLVALLLAVIIVHTIYVTVVRPNADSTIRHHAEMAAAGEEYVVPRSFFIVVKDIEQEVLFYSDVLGAGHYGLQNPHQHARDNICSNCR